MSEPINDPVNHPSHYTDGPTLGRLECLDVTRWLPFDLGNAFKYIWRAGKKNPERFIEDLEKARFYLRDWSDLYAWQKTLNHGRVAAEMLFLKADIKHWESWRYRVLFAIVRGNERDAITILDEQIADAKNATDAAFSRYFPEDETDDD